LSKIFLFFEDDQNFFYYESVISNTDDQLELYSKKNTSLELFLKNQNQTQLVILDTNHSDRDAIINALEKREKSIPCILIGEEEELDILSKQYKSQTLLYYFLFGESVESLQALIQKLINVHQRATQEKRYCKMNLSFFWGADEIFCDVFLKISDGKYVKVFNRYQKIDQDDLVRFQKKSVRYLYVRDRDFSLITQHLVQSLRPVLSQEGENNQLIHGLGAHHLPVSVPIQLQETVAESINQLGLTEDAVEMTSFAINATMELLGKRPEVYKIIEESVKNHNYLSEHSFFLAYLTGAILAETPWSNERNVIALTCAAFFHDINLKTDEMAKIQDIHEQAFKNLAPEEQEIVKNHPTEAVKTIQGIEGLPQEAFLIIGQHHEKFDGSGFPAGLNHNRLHPLSSLFIVAHQIALYLFENGGHFDNLPEFLQELEAYYNKGNFQTVLLAAKKVFLSGAHALEEDKKAVS
jgi:HD-GYP domain-containing protein (c-di-GMP phosphodiesterase class II)